MGAGGSKHNKLFDELFKNSLALLKDAMAGLDITQLSTGAFAWRSGACGSSAHVGSPC